MGRVQDRVAVVTGAARGLGQAISYRLAQEGARLVLGDIDEVGWEITATKIRDSDGEVITLVGDVTEEEIACQLVECAIKHYSQIDILVNNAGSDIGGRRDFHEGDIAEWVNTIQINVSGLMQVTAAVLPGMLTGQGGHIVNLGSVAGLSGVRGCAASVAGKG